ncbi:hypothetical protein DFP72DRAFT_264665 [Ephemerocybe angulata]|uniref:F-box domain-containing protein n=1 Tax=Ephemerocybe angulata TaxID=980116 RepID=A0A8H6I122_9AGAR|nr:hypothetical protein DFP72DRAFT_264665 [Tulosesus angulatus]
MFPDRQSANALGGIHLSSASPVRKLPAELLSMIFTEAIEQRSNPSLNVRPSNPTVNLISISNVSQRWRNIASGIPALWASSIDPTRLTQKNLARFLENSKTKDLRIKGSVGTYYKMYYGLDTQQWKTAFDMMHRIAELDVQIDGKIEADIAESLADALAIPAPRLRRLSLQSSSSNDEPIQIPFIRYDGVYRPLFANVAPLLEHIDFQNVNFEYTSNTVAPTLALPSLRTFAIRMPGEHRVDVEGCVEWWWAVFTSGRTPKLESISVTGVELLTDYVYPAYKSYTTATSATTTRRALPSSLKTLTLAGELEACDWLLGMAEVPATCNVHLEMVEFANQYGDVTVDPRPARLAGHLQNLWTASEDNKLCSTLDVRLDIGEFGLKTASSPREVALELRVPDENGDEGVGYEHVKFFAKIFEHLVAPGSHLRLCRDGWLRLDVKCGMQCAEGLDKQFKAFLRRNSSVRNLNVEMFYYPETEQDWMGVLGAVGDDGGRTWFPELRCLRISDRAWASGGFQARIEQFQEVKKVVGERAVAILRDGEEGFDDLGTTPC